MNERGIDWASIRNMKADTATRRMVWPDPDMHMILIDSNMADRHVVLRWIEERTTGLFYLGGLHVAFKDEKDELIFKLSFK